MGTEIFSLEGKRALVTGASRGIGAAIALGFAECGADVAVTARSTSDLEDLAGKIAAAGRRGVPITCDVTQTDEITRCVDTALDALGGIDILVNNAGGTRFMAPVLALREEGWDKAINLNLKSVFTFCQKAGAHMVERGSGSVINVASVGGLHASPTLSFYGAAKAGVVSLTKTLSVEWGSAGVRVNALCPGWVKTELNRNLWGEDPEVARSTVQNVPLQRWGETADLVGAAVYLASDAAAYTNGSVLVIDGGMLV
jgi:NAD(P)-dependent dehydrogenase (short-subunit alcohol dehydrogenase family)